MAGSRTWLQRLLQHLQLHPLRAAKHSKCVPPKVGVDSGLGTGRQLNAVLQKLC